MGALGLVGLAVQHGGRELSYLNLFDADPPGGWFTRSQGSTARPPPSSSKHANPCGVAVAADTATAYRLAFEGDPLSAFGGIVALSGPVDGELAEAILANPVADVLVAPGYDEGVPAALPNGGGTCGHCKAQLPRPWGGGCGRSTGASSSGARPLAQRPRLLAPCHEGGSERTAMARPRARLARVRTDVVERRRPRQGGPGRGRRLRPTEPRGRCRSRRSQGGWSGCRWSGRQRCLLPLRDGLDALADVGVGAVVQPGGSLRDDEIVAAADERGIAMVLTGERHFRH